MTISRKDLGFLFHPERRQLPAPGKVGFPRECPSFSHMIFPWRIAVLCCQDNTHQFWKWGRDLCRAESSGLVAELSTASAGPGWGCREWRCLEAGFNSWSYWSGWNDYLHSPAPIWTLTRLDLCLTWTLQYKYYSQSYDNPRNKNEQQGSLPHHKPQGHICYCDKNWKLLLALLASNCPLFCSYG